MNLNKALNEVDELFLKILKEEKQHIKEIKYDFFRGYVDALADVEAISYVQAIELYHCGHNAMIIKN